MNRNSTLRWVNDENVHLQNYEMSSWGTPHANDLIQFCFSFFLSFFFYFYLRARPIFLEPFFFSNEHNQLSWQSTSWLFTFMLSSSFTRFCISCLWRAWFSSNILILLKWIWDCKRARVCMHLIVLLTWRFTAGPSINDFNLTSPLRALNALLAWRKV